MTYSEMPLAQRLVRALSVFFLKLRVPDTSRLAIVVLARLRRPTPLSRRDGLRMIVGDVDPLVSALRASMLAGRYETGLVTLARAAVRAGDAVIDVGAHEGYLSLLLARRVGPSGHVYAIEPNPENQNMLRTNVALNEIANVTVLSYAAGDSRRSVTLWGTDAWGTVLQREQATSRPRRSVEMATLDSLFEDLPTTPPLRLVKIDTEGSEIAVFRGARNLIRRSRPVLIFEVNLSLLAYVEASIGEVFQYLEESGYRLFRESDGGLRAHSWLTDRISNYFAIPVERCNEGWVEHAVRGPRPSAG